MIFQHMRYTSYIIIYSIFVWHVLEPSLRSGVFSLDTTYGHYFVPRPLCYLEERLAAGCMVPFDPVTPGNILKCAVTCANDRSCIGFSRNLSSGAQPHQKLYQHWPCDRVFSLCVDANPEMK